jgi:hypothetical protein
MERKANIKAAPQNREIISKIPLSYSLPALNLEHVKKLTTDFGIKQILDADLPLNDFVYTLDDNARALIVMCRCYELKRQEADIAYIYTYFNFIKHCLQPEGYFLNYVNEKKKFTGQNNSINLADANGKAIWALGYLASFKEILPEELVDEAETIIQALLPRINSVHSTRAMAFTIKGLYYYNIEKQSGEISSMIKGLADKLVQMHKHESDNGWNWFERYFSYANSVLPDAVLCAYLATEDKEYKNIAKTSFDFLLSNPLTPEGIKAFSEPGWKDKSEETRQYGEHPLNAAYTIVALDRFYEVFNCGDYLDKIEKCFNWYLGDNYLQKNMYNYNTGGCYESLRTDEVYKEGTSSTLGYLMARLTVEKYFNKEPLLVSVDKFTADKSEVSFRDDESQELRFRRDI